MVLSREIQIQGKHLDIDAFSQKIVQQLELDGFKVRMGKGPLGVLIQAQKGGFLADIITAERALTISITGQPDSVTVKVGIGKLAQNIAVAVAEAVLLSELFLAVDVPEMLWTRHVETQIIQKIRQIAEMP